MTGSAQSAAATAAGMAQGTAHQVADRATAVGQQVAGRATVAAQQVAHQVADRASASAAAMSGRARPMAAEAASRGGAAWQVIRHGAPQPSPLARMATVVPLVTVTTAAPRSRAPLGMMAVGAAGAVGLLWWRRSRAGADSVWILDSDSRRRAGRPLGGARPRGAPTTPPWTPDAATRRPTAGPERPPRPRFHLRTPKGVAG